MPMMIKVLLDGIEGINNTLKEIRNDISELNTGFKVNDLVKLKK